jgi:hypothetical protein
MTHPQMYGLNVDLQRERRQSTGISTGAELSNIRARDRSILFIFVLILLLRSMTTGPVPIPRRPSPVMPDCVWA